MRLCPALVGSWGLRGSRPLWGLGATPRVALRDRAKSFYHNGVKGRSSLRGLEALLQCGCAAESLQAQYAFHP